MKNVEWDKTGGRLRGGTRQGIFGMVLAGLAMAANLQASEAPDVPLPTTPIAASEIRIRGAANQTARACCTEASKLFSAASATGRCPHTGHNPTNAPQSSLAGSVQYWKTNPDQWPVSVIEVGGVQYTKEAAIRQILSGTGPDASLQLSQQLIVAKLNYAKAAARADSSVEYTFGRAKELLRQQPPGSGAQGEVRSQILDVTAALQAFSHSPVAQVDERVGRQPAVGVAFEKSQLSAKVTAAD